MWATYHTTGLFITTLLFTAGLAEKPSSAWKTGKFKTLVTFGDSYTDENRLGYFNSHNGSAPPVGWEQPLGLKTASGGLSWARYASIYSNATLYNYAVSGAACSNAITPRSLTSTPAFPDVAGYELPAFIADSSYITPNGSKFFTGQPKNTVYALWIGTNDLGNNAFLTNSQVKGKTVKDFVDCVYDTITSLYENGGRYFVLLNLAPLNLLPQYATPENGGLSATQFWPDKTRYNITDVSYRMQETVVSLNEVFKYRTPSVSASHPGMQIASFDVNALMTDVWSNPGNYLNGTAPLNVTGVVHQCGVNGQNCTLAASPDSYLWYDPLHPSEQTSRIVAREFVNVLGGKSKWAAYWQ
ncbi:carbohydrate esterase family 16 protein [Dothidotthia symphoricarpi CBS 119687]|uniref:Carbohydrate esterase family 16 protein n=1 Tax=Dothidotthia symphoricarpi CBS 119687 TaxID=1392245 RepID=A0A6A6A1W9_9PLEO|nr:carbohydrate esterase family 16 protein [Dothidotthia symphoricarpi CBS 119687]KAF2125174.1 carbohydrate esterase family 16 protein [Dothidotthia symphoricarpi CBS 119687]